MIYRQEIDGIRAIAVLSVILYHAGFAFANSGYAGVDIFFVISGYLIGGQILDELNAGTFSFREFYKRRARRILPALFLVVIASMLVGAFVLMPRDYRYFGGAALSTLLFVSNVWFMERIDYFNPQAAQDPLVHTWSLGIEEQFYILVPLVLMLLWRYLRSGLVMSLGFLLVVSVCAAITLNESHPESSFYLLHTRAWELLSGVLVAWWLRSRYAAMLSQSPALNTVGALSGLALVLLGVAAVPSAAPWPGAWTIVPVLGVVLLLLFGDMPSPVRTILSLQPVRFIGLISYSAYLWHQPVFSFLEVSGRIPHTEPGLLLVVGVVLTLSALSWRYVELPFRRRQVPSPWGRLALLSAAAGIAVFAVGGHLTKGYANRISPEATRILAYADSYGQDYERCIRSRVHVPDMRLEDACILGAEVPPTVAIWGDSHAARLADPLGDALAEVGKSVVALTVTSCQPIPGLINYGQTRAPQCPEFNDRVMAHLLANNDIEAVVLFAIWDSYFSRDAAPNLLGYRRGGDALYTHLLGSSPTLPEDARQKDIISALRKTLSDLTASGKRVVLVASLPRPDVRIPEFVAQAVWNGERVEQVAGYPREYFSEQTRLGREIFAKATESLHDVTLIYPEEYFCDDDQCFYLKSGHPLFSDGNHPTLEGSALIVPSIVDAIR